MNPTPEQRKAIEAYVHSDLVPLIEDVLVKRLGLAAVFMRDKLLAEPVMPTDEEIVAWADDFIREHAYNRPVAVQIATEAAKWVRSRIAAHGVKATFQRQGPGSGRDAPAGSIPPSVSPLVPRSDLMDAYRALQNTLLVVPDGKFKRDMDDWLTAKLAATDGVTEVGRG